MILRLVALLTIFSSFTYAAAEEPIPWKAERKLTWADFKAVPDKNSGNAALTSSGISFSWSYDGAGKFSYTITCSFDKMKSWVRVKNDHILAHEQGHFDISEIHARKLNKALAEYRFKESSVNKDVNAIYSKVINELTVMQAQYDRETQHSKDFARQKEWEKLIGQELINLKAYAGYQG